MEKELDPKKSVYDVNDESQCPVTGHAKHSSGGGTKNRDWWLEPVEFKYTPPTLSPIESYGREVQLRRGVQDARLKCREKRHF